MLAETQLIVDALHDASTTITPDGFDNPDYDNADRAERAARAAQHYFESTRHGDPCDRFDEGAAEDADGVREVVQDLINDLCHLAHENGVNVEELLARAYVGYRTEQENALEAAAEEVRGNDECDCGTGWLHMNDSMGRGPGIEACDECEKYDSDAAAQEAHDRECSDGPTCRYRQAEE